MFCCLKQSFSLIDGAYLAVGSHDNFVYIYAVTENGRKYNRVSKCTVSHFLSTKKMSMIPPFLLS